MKKKIVITVLVLFLMQLAWSVLPTAAADDLIFDGDTTIDLDTPDTNLTVKSGSTVDSLTNNGTDLSLTISASNYLVIESDDGKTLSLSPTVNGATFTCATPSRLVISPPSNASTQTVTLTASATACTPTPGSSAPSSSSPSSSSPSSSSPTPTTTTTTDTAKPKTTAPAAKTTEPAPAPAAKTTPVSTAPTVQNMVAEAATLVSDKPMQLAAAMGIKTSEATETAAETKYTAQLVSGVKTVTLAAKDAITYFVAYGTPTTKSLGAGERAGVVSSYKSAFGKIPAKDSEWADAIKIANGRWPAERSTASEKNASLAFKKIYKREANMSQKNDNAAVTVIAYGLRPAKRNTNSEQTAIRTFKAVYKYAPKSAAAWDLVRAIAYSGAKR